MSQKIPLDMEYVDRPDVMEAYADALEKLSLDPISNVLRLEFAVVRVGDEKNGRRKGRRYPTCRVVLPMTAVEALLNQFVQLGRYLESTGVINKVPISPPQGSGKPN